MKIRFLLLFIFCCTGMSFAQMPAWHWARAGNCVPASTQGSYESRGIAIDNQGNSYVTGVFSTPTIKFGNITIGNAGGTSLTDDIYLVKYNAAGTVVWARRAGNAANNTVWAIGVDSAGNCYITGHYALNIQFGSILLAPPLTAGGSNFGYIAKYNANGVVVWAKTTGYNTNNGSVSPRSIAVTAGGDCFITGLCDGNNVVFDTTTLPNTNVLWDYDIFLAKYNASGQLSWAKRPIGASRDEATSVSVDQAGNSYLTGSSESPTLNFGGQTLTNPGGERMFIVKYNATGNAVWAQNSGYVSGASSGTQIATDTSGHTYVLGTYGGYALELDTLVIQHPSGEWNTSFLAKYNSAGRILWLRNTIRSQNQGTYDMGVDVWGNSYVTGIFSDSVARADTFRITGEPTNFNFYAVKFNPTGKVVWLRNVDGTTIVKPNGIAVSPLGISYITGDFGDGNGNRSATFGTTTFPNLLPAVFTAKLAGCNLPPRQSDSIAGPDTVCANMPVLFSVPPVLDATSYQWTLPTGWNGSSSTNQILVTTGSNRGVIKVAAVNDCGVGPDRSFNIPTVLPAPAPIIVRNGNVLQVTTAFNSYQWYRNGSPLAGETTSSLTLVQGQGGNYYVMAADTNACSGPSNMIGYLLDVQTASSIAPFTVSPNPAFDKSHVHFYGGAEKGVLILSDLLGRTLQTFEVVPGTAHLVVELKDLPSGIYIITYQTNVSSSKVKLLKK